MKTRISAIICMAVLMMGLMVGCGGTSSDDLEKKLQKMERLCLEERYEEAVAFADEYWFSHPCPISDVVSGQNTLYKDLSEDEIRFRLRLAAHTKNPNSFNLLNCIILDNLLYKRLEDVATMLPAYLRLSGQTSSSDEASTYTIPKPLQEAF